MKDDEKQTIALITKLTRLTKEGHLTWQKIRPPTSLTETSNYEIAAFYKTRYKKHDLALYDLRYQMWDDTGEVIGWDQRYQLAVLDEDGDILWQFPRVPGLHELASSIAYKVGNVDQVLKDLLEED